MSGTLNKYLQLLKKNIDRKSLVLIAAKLNISGHTNKYCRPYIKKDALKVLILNELKRRSFKRSKSVSNLAGGSISSPPVRRTRSTGSINFHQTSLSPHNYKVESINTMRIPKVARIVAIGDIHGDMRVIVRALKIAGVIPLSTPEDNSINEHNVPWTGGRTVIVQVGDQIDRARPSCWHNDCITEEIPFDEGSDIKIMNLLDNLNIKARNVGGAIVSILGNHELMNVEGDFRYVSLNEFSEFGEALSQPGKNKKKDYPYGYDERKIAFAPGGVMAKRMAETRFGVAQVGSWLFVHGGITPKLALKYSADHINYYTKQWLRGDRSRDTLNVIDDIFHNEDEDYSPYWSRVFSDHDDWNENRVKYLFENSLKIMNNRNARNNRKQSVPIVGMVLGHSPQYMWNKGINSSFNNRLWRVDVGMSRAFGPLQQDHKYRKIQILEIKNDTQISILTEA